MADVHLSFGYEVEIQISFLMLKFWNLYTHKIEKANKMI